MNDLGESNWLKKRIEEYERLIRSEEMTKEEAEHKMKLLELRLSEIGSRQAVLQ